MEKMRIIMTFTVLLLLCVLNRPIRAREEQKVIYKYKKRETIDLGSLEIQGQIIAPGDLSIEKRSRKVFSRDLYYRENFLREIKKDINNLR